MPKSSRRRHRPQGTNARRNLLIAPAIAPLARQPAPDLSRVARGRLAMVDWHRAHGANVSRTARHFGFSRPTVYRWLARYDRLRLETLEDRSSAPVRRRRPTWTLGQLGAVRELRARYPRWGKAVERPGDLVQIDTVEIRPFAGHPFKQFTARDVISRWDTLEVRRSATARLASEMLEALALRMPFPVRAISVDGGSEFMAEFEAACQARGIALFVLPPRSPKLHGSVERANRTHTEEFYEVTDGLLEPDDIRGELLAWERTYNTVRPHQALGYLTPAEYLTSVGIDV